MEYLRQIEEDLLALGVEAKKRHPEIKESTDRSLACLKSIREVYVSEMMRKSHSSEQAHKKKVVFPQSSDLLSPYLLTCNYSDASPKIVLMALNGMQLLLNYELLPPADVQNILRVLSIQANSGKSEVQLKLLQLILQLANFLSKDTMTSPYFTESAVCNLITLSLQLCDIKNNVSVSTTAFATARQVIALILNGVKELYDKYEYIQLNLQLQQTISGSGNSSSGSVSGQKNTTSSSNTGSNSTTLNVQQLSLSEVGEEELGNHSNNNSNSSIENDNSNNSLNEFMSASLTISAHMIIKDIVLFLKGTPGEWCKGVYLSLALSLDLLYDILLELKKLFIKIPSFQLLLKKFIFPAIRPLLQGLKDDYVAIVSRSGLSTGSSITSRIIRISRCFMLEYIMTPSSPHITKGVLLEELDLIVTFMIHALQPDFGYTGSNNTSGSGSSGGINMMNYMNNNSSNSGSSSSSHIDRILMPSSYTRHYNSATGSGSNADTSSSSMHNNLAGSFISRLNLPVQGMAANIGKAINTIQTTVQSPQQTQSPYPTGPANSMGNNSNLSGISGSNTYTIPMNMQLIVALTSLSSHDLSLGTGSSSNNAVYNNMNNSNTPLGYIPSHPSGCCLEALLSFFISTVPVDMLHTAESCQILQKCMTSILLCISTLIKDTISIRANMELFEVQCKVTPLIPLMESLISGNEVDIHSILRSLHETVTTANIEASETFIYAFLLLRILLRYITKISIGTYKLRKLKLSPRGMIFIDDALLQYMQEIDGNMVDTVYTQLCILCDNSVDNIYETTLIAYKLCGNGNRYILDKSMDMIYEVAVICGVNHIQKACDYGIIQLCKLAIPTSYDFEILSVDYHTQQDSSISSHTTAMSMNNDLINDVMTNTSSTTTAISSGSSGLNKTTTTIHITYYNLASFHRAIQLISVFADVIYEWDHIVDCFEKIYDLYKSYKDTVGNNTNTTSSSSNVAMSAISSQTSTSNSGSTGGTAALANNHISSTSTSSTTTGSTMHHLPPTSMSSSTNPTHPHIPNNNNSTTSSTTSAMNSITIKDVDYVLNVLEQFKSFTIFLSSETLVKLMTSLVVMSLNTLSMTKSSSYSSSNTGVSAGGTGNAPTMSSTTSATNSSNSNNMTTSTASKMKVSYSLYAIVDITKLNIFRASCIWQMVTSHLRILASMKSSWNRKYAVNSTYDMIHSALESHMDMKQIVFMNMNTTKEDDSSSNNSIVNSNKSLVNGNTSSSSSSSSTVTAIPLKDISPILKDHILYTILFPKQYKCLQPTRLLKELLYRRHSTFNSNTNTVSTASNSTYIGPNTPLSSSGNLNEPSLAQQDLLTSLKSLSIVKTDDIRVFIIEKLLLLLQSKGHLLRSGWSVIIELLSWPPLSHIKSSNDATTATTTSIGVEGNSTNAAVESVNEVKFGTETMNTLTSSTSTSSLTLDNTNTNTSNANARGSMINKPSAAVPPPVLSASPSSSALNKSDSIETVVSWPLISLLNAFNCVKLIIDEDLEYMSHEILVQLLSCLTQFGHQTTNTNIGLTSIEMIWKVYDSTYIRYKSSIGYNTINSASTITALSAENMNNILDTILIHYVKMSLDPRPEIRNCAMNTLFLLLNRYMKHITPIQLHHIYLSVIFPLCTQTKEKSIAAIDDNMSTTITPELKKGVKMNIHHSRDTLAKQWSETRTLVLRGLERMLQSTIKIALDQEWFITVWKEALSVCKEAITRTLSHDPEVTQTALYVLFSMLKMTKKSDSTSYSSLSPRTAAAAAINTTTNTNTMKAVPSKSDISQSTSTAAAGSSTATTATNTIHLSTRREELWILAWYTVKDASVFSSPTSELATQMCHSLSHLYIENADIFKRGSNLKIFLEVVVIISRPRLEFNETTKMVMAKKESSHTQSQLYKALMNVLKSIKIIDLESFYVYLATLSDIAFSTQVVELLSTTHDEKVYLGPCGEKLRLEIGQYIVDSILSMDNILQYTVDDIYTYDEILLTVTEIVTGRFVSGSCSVYYTHRHLLYTYQHTETDITKDVTELSTAGVGVGARVGDNGNKMPTTSEDQGYIVVKTHDKKRTRSSESEYIQILGNKIEECIHIMQTYSFIKKKSTAMGRSTSSDSSNTGHQSKDMKVKHDQVVEGNDGEEEDDDMIGIEDTQVLPSLQSLSNNNNNNNNSALSAIFQLVTGQSDTLIREVTSGNNSCSSSSSTDHSIWAGYLNTYHEMFILIELLKKYKLAPNSTTSNDILSSNKIQSTPVIASTTTSTTKTTTSSTPILPISTTCWKKIVISLSCILTPWTKMETAIERSTSIDYASVTPALFLERLTSLLDCILDLNLQKRLSDPSSFSSIVDLLSATAQILASSIQQSLTTTTATSTTTTGNVSPIISTKDSTNTTTIASRTVILPFNTQIEYLVLIRKKLVHVLTSTQRTLSVRTRALDGYLKVVMTLLYPLCNYTATNTLHTASPSYHMDMSPLSPVSPTSPTTLASNTTLFMITEDYMYECNMFLEILVDMELDFSYFPENMNYFSAETNDNIVQDWIQTTHTIFNMKDENHHIHTGTSTTLSSSASSTHTPTITAAVQPITSTTTTTNTSSHNITQYNVLKCKTHLISILPIAVKLAGMKELPILQKTAKHVLNTLNLPQVLMDFSQLVTRLEHIESENRLLKEEVREAKQVNIYQIVELLQNTLKCTYLWTTIKL